MISAIWYILNRTTTILWIITCKRDYLITVQNPCTTSIKTKSYQPSDHAAKNRPTYYSGRTSWRACYCSNASSNRSTIIFTVSGN